MPTATSLLRRVQLRDEQAWCALTELYGPLVYHWCRRMGLDSHQAADIFQEVFASVARTIGDYELDAKHGSFRGWLWRITRNKILDGYRRNQKHPAAEGGTEAMMRFADHADPFTDESQDDEDRTESSSLIHRAMELIRPEFEPKTWDAFFRATVKQEPTTEIAAEMNMSKASVRQAKSRVLRRLRAIIDE